MSTSARRAEPATSTAPAGQPLLSAVYIIDELQSLERLPWRESVHSALKFVDELIVVHGGKSDADGRQPAWEYLQSLNDPRVQLHHFPWPEDFDWRQIGRSCAFGHLQARGAWCMRVLADEVFADDFFRIREVLSSAGPSLRLVLVDRLYLLGHEFAHPNHLQLIFRNDKTLGFGTVNPAQGGAAMPGLFDSPIETDFWFDGRDVVSIRDDSILRDPRGVERLLAGETPRGYRPPALKGFRHVELGVFNVDVNYFTDAEIIRQKETSHGGYDRLPAGYSSRVFPQADAILDALSKKQGSMVESGRLRRVKLPAALMEFHRRHRDVDNPTSRTCRLYGLPWSEGDPTLSVAALWLKRMAIRLRRSWRRGKVTA